MLRKKKAHKNRHTLYTIYVQSISEVSVNRLMFFFLALFLEACLGLASLYAEPETTIVVWWWIPTIVRLFASTQYPSIYHPSRLMLVPSGLLKRAKKWSRLVQFQQSVEQRCRGILMHTKHICAYYWVDSWSDLQSIFHKSFDKWNSAND